MLGKYQISVALTVTWMLDEVFQKPLSSWDFHTLLSSIKKHKGSITLQLKNKVKLK